MYSLCWSFVLDYENTKNPYEEKRRAIAPWAKFAVDFCPPSECVRVNSKRLMDQYGVKNMDALHVACAIERKCEYLITTDKRLANKPIADIKIINPIDFINEMEDNNEN